MMLYGLMDVSTLTMCSTELYGSYDEACAAAREIVGAIVVEVRYEIW